jgi:MATE family multidrug resistance protein
MHIFGRLFRPDWERLATIIRVGVPIAFTLAFEVTVFSAAVYLMGLISQTSVAAHAIALQIASVTFMVPLGISQATTIRVGLGYGAKDAAWITRAGSASLVMAMGFMSLAAIIMWLFPRDLASLFLDAAKPENGPVLDLAVRFLFIAAIFQLADGAQVVGAAMLRGLQDTRVPMYYAAFGYWAVGLGGGAALAFLAGWQGIGVWTGLAGGLAVVAVLMLWRWSRRGRLGLVAYG